MPLLSWKKFIHVERMFIRKGLSGHLSPYLRLCLGVQKLLSTAEARRASNGLYILARDRPDEKYKRFDDILKQSCDCFSTLIQLRTVWLWGKKVVVMKMLSTKHPQHQKKVLKRPNEREAKS